MKNKTRLSLLALTMLLQFSTIACANGAVAFSAMQAAQIDSSRGASKPEYGKTTSEWKFDPVSQPAGSVPADGYVVIQSSDPFLKKYADGRLQFCLKNKPIPWWSGKSPSYSTEWGGPEQYIKQKPPGGVTTAEYVGLGTNTWTGEIVLFYRTSATSDHK